MPVIKLTRAQWDEKVRKEKLAKLASNVEEDNRSPLGISDSLNQKLVATTPPDSGMKDELKTHNPDGGGVRLFIATDGRAMKRAELALEYSAKKHASGPVDIEWMDEERGEPNWTGWNRKKWYTRFTCFRFSIPELSGFKGRSIYVDVDQLFLDDIYKLINLPIPDDKMFLALHWIRTDVMVMDNAKFKNLDWWPSVEEMKKSGWGAKNYLNLLKDHDVVGKLPSEWCCNDGKGYEKGKTKHLHFTEMKTQPWKPYPKGWRSFKFDYPDHPHQESTRVWWEYYAKALEDKFDLNYQIQYHTK